MLKDDLRHHYPSMFAKQAIDGVSTKYSFVDTETIIDTFLANDFYISKASAVNVRLPKNKEHCKHFLNFRHNSAPTIMDSRALNEPIFPEVTVSNSSDARAAIVLTISIFAKVCSNGLIKGTQHEMLRMRHTRVDMQQLTTYIGYFQDNVKLVQKQINDFSGVYLTPEQQFEMAKKAVSLRWSGEGKVDPITLLQSRRDSDRGNSLWSTFNRIQENIIKGGVTTINSRDTHSRAVRSPMKDYDINVKLWQLAEEYLK